MFHFRLRYHKRFAKITAHLRPSFDLAFSWKANVI